MSENRSHYTMIPFLIDDLELDVYQFRVYCAIKRCSGDDGHCTKSYSTISKECRISERKVIATIQKLCEDNPIIKKPLISKKTRKTEHGDSDTCIIVVNDIWKENSQKFKKYSGGACGAPRPAHHAPPGAHDAGGVVHMVHQGGAYGAPKEELLKKNYMKKTTTPTSSSSAESVDKSSLSSFSKEKELEEEAAISLKNMLDKEADKVRRRGIAHITWGSDWYISIKTFKDLIMKYGISYFHENLMYVVNAQISFDKGKSKKGVNNPESYLRRACRENYAESTNTKEIK